MAFSAVAKPHSPFGFGPVSTFSISLRFINEKMKVLLSKTTTSISLRSLMFLITELKEISVLFFRSKSSQITTLFGDADSTSTMKLVLYIISISSTLSFKI